MYFLKGQARTIFIQILDLVPLKEYAIYTRSRIRYDENRDQGWVIAIRVLIEVVQGSKVKKSLEPRKECTSPAKHMCMIDCNAWSDDMVLEGSN